MAGGEVVRVGLLVPGGGKWETKALTDAGEDVDGKDGLILAFTPAGTAYTHSGVYWWGAHPPDALLAVLPSFQ